MGTPRAKKGTGLEYNYDELWTLNYDDEDEDDYNEWYDMICGLDEEHNISVNIPIVLALFSINATHSWNKAVWKPKGFTRENRFQQISRKRLVWEQSWKKKLGFILDFSPG